MNRIIRFYWPLLLVLALTLLATGYIALLEEPACERLAGINVSLLSLAVFCFLLPALLATASAYSARAGVMALKQGCFPPIGFPLLERQKPHYHGRARFKAGIALIIPVLALVTVIMGFNAFNAIVDGRSLEQLQTTVEQDCEKSIAGAGLHTVLR